MKVKLLACPCSLWFVVVAMVSKLEGSVMSFCWPFALQHVFSKWGFQSLTVL